MADDVAPYDEAERARRLGAKDGTVTFENTLAVPDYDGAPVAAELVTVGTAEGPRPAWQVQADRASNASYVVLVDAVTGEVLVRQNQLSEDNQGTVFQGEDPEAGGRSQIVFPAGWATAGDTTSGNNVNAYQDAAGDNSAQAADQPHDADRHWNYTWNDPWGASVAGAEADLPLTGADRDAVVTQLFYYTNWYHDYAYDLGFTETARNFQNDNFGNGGSGGDAVEAESDANFTGQQCDSGGNPVKCLNNANFNTNGADGTKPRMQMYVGDTNPGGMARRTQRANNRDTIIHEYTHGISGRIISDGNLAGGIQSSSLGEGWSDAFATSINDDPVYGEYNNGDYTNGIRGVAYDDDSLEYGDFAGTSEHDNGRIWAMNMWEVRAALIAKYGAATGKDKHERLMMLGLKNTADTPSFHDARTGLPGRRLHPEPHRHRGCRGELVPAVVRVRRQRARRDRGVRPGHRQRRQHHRQHRHPGRVRAGCRDRPGRRPARGQRHHLRRHRLDRRRRRGRRPVVRLGPRQRRRLRRLDVGHAHVGVRRQRRPHGRPPGEQRLGLHRHHLGLVQHDQRGAHGDGRPGRPGGHGGERHAHRRGHLLRPGLAGHVLGQRRPRDVVPSGREPGSRGHHAGRQGPR